MCTVCIDKILEGSKSPEAQVCIGAFHHAKSHINKLLWDCGSARELLQRGFTDDVKHCAHLNVYQVAPFL